jgi:hypothetical protein
MKRLMIALLAMSAAACHTTVDDYSDAPQGSFSQSYVGNEAPPLRPNDGFAIQAPDGYVSLVFSDSDVNACLDGFDPGTTRLAFEVPPWALTSAGPNRVDVVLDTVDSHCRNLRSSYDAPSFAQIAIDFVGNGEIRGSYKYNYHGTDVSGSFDVAFCGGHPAGDDLACQW